MKRPHPYTAMYRFLLLVGLLCSLAAGRAWAQDATPLTVGEPITRDLGAHDLQHPIIVHGVLTLTVCIMPLFVPSLR